LVDGTGERLIKAGSVGQHDQHSLFAVHVQLSQHGSDSGRPVS
jgi:hypothetical protein